MKPNISPFLLTRKASLMLVFLLALTVGQISGWPAQPIAQASVANQGTVPPPPATDDDFDNATLIQSLPFNEIVDTSSATTAPDDPTDCHNNGSVWYAFTPTATVFLTANTIGSNYDTTLAAYTGTRGGLSLVPGACNDDFYGVQSRIAFQATAGVTYYFLVGFCCGTSGGTGGGILNFSLQAVIPPTNDNFANAIAIASLPFTDNPETTGSTSEAGEPHPSCNGMNEPQGTIWYTFFAPDNRSLSATANSFGPYATTLAVYTGGNLNTLTEVNCHYYGGSLTLQARAGTTYYFQISNSLNSAGPVQFGLDITPPPVANFAFSPSDPSTFDTIQLYNYSYDPGNVGFQNENWDFGDGATATGCCPTHRYASDGDYRVQLQVMTFDGRSASTNQNLSVRTHDVAITKFSRPNSGRVGQTAKLAVGIANRNYPETVRVDLYKSDPHSYDGFQLVGSLEQFVPVQSNKKTTDFLYSYTFTSDDAALGKISFKAVATINNSRDALPADNAFITLPILVSIGKTRSSPPLNDAVTMTDDVANGEAIPATIPQGEQKNVKLYVPLVVQQ